MSAYKNYNVTHKLFLDAVSEFESFIPGIDPAGTTAPLSAVPFGWIMKLDDTVAEDVATEEKQAREQKLKQRRLAAKLLDRTVGSYFLKDFPTVAATVPDAGDVTGTEYISFVYDGTTGTFGKALRQHDVSGTIQAADNPAGFAEMNHVLSQVNVGLVKRKAVQVSAADSNDAASDSNLEADDKKYKVDFSSMPSHKAKAGAGGVQPNNIINGSLGGGLPDRFKNPSMGAIVLKDSSTNFSSRQSSHLPIFFGAVTPLEMSRSTVYLDFRIMSTDQRHKAGRVNSVNFLGFPGRGDQYQMFRVNDPVGTEDGSGLKAANSYMDVFTSTQTMVNANMNRYGIAEAAAELVEDLFNTEPENALNKFNNYNAVSVIDPMQPFMTLKSAEVRITGAGAALLSTKTATVELKLHDKSRIRDLSPLLSVDSFGFTKVFMEFGWSHPEGTFLSTNTVGKYLNGLRDVSTYTVKNVSYNFGADNSVDITLELASIGAAQSQAVHAGAGTHSSLRMYQDLIRRCFTLIAKGLEVKNSKYRKNRELRSQIFVTSRNAGSINQLVEFEKIKDLHEAFAEVSNTDLTEAVAKDILKKLMEALGVSSAAAFANASDAPSFEKILAATNGELNERAARAGDLVFAKLLASINTLDPFQMACVRNSTATQWAAGGSPGAPPPGVIGFDGNKPRTYQEMSNRSDPHVTLGKLICQFVAQPLASSGLYDEVQVYFYPVNNHAGAARIHTTASLPIPFQRVEAAFQKILGAAGKGRLKNNLTAQGAFRVFDDICADRTIPAYGIYSKDGSLAEFHDFKKKEYADKVTAAFAGLVAGGRFAGQSEANIRSVLDDSRGLEETQVNNLAIRAYEKQLLETHTQELTTILQKIYTPPVSGPSPDGYEGFSLADRFTPVNLNMFLETSPGLKSSQVGTVSAHMADSLLVATTGFAGAIALREKLFDKGTERDKQILKLHIYDQNASSNPLLRTWFTRTAADSKVVGRGMTNESYDALRDKPFTYWKTLVKSFYPSITHGANTGTVLNVTITGKTGTDLSNVQLVDGYEQARGISSSQNSPNFDETIIFPGTIRLELMGNPTISRGQEIFIDFGTNTSLDNVYVVDNVSHTIKAGEFITVCDMHVANQGMVYSTRSKAISKIKALQPNL